MQNHRGIHLDVGVRRNASLLPVPCMNVINGGAHSDAPIDFQEFMVVPKGFDTFSRGLQAITEIFHALKSVLKNLNSMNGGHHHAFFFSLTQAKLFAISP